jgi:hypothetical protein
MSDRRHRAYLFFIVGFFVFYFASSLLPSPAGPLVFWGGSAVAALCYGIVASEDGRRREAVRRGGVELEAEILGRYEAGALEGSEMAKMRQGMMGSEDPVELELRYLFDGREIVSRGRVSVKTYFHTRGLKTLKIKVSPEQPKEWVEFAG